MITIKELNDFLNHLEVEKNYSKHTINAYKTDLTQFFTVIDKHFSKITKQDVLEFLKYLKDKEYSSTTSNRKLASIKSFYKYLLVEGKVRVNPAELIESAKIEKTLPKIVSVEEYELLLSKIDNLEDKALIELLFATGVRREEVVNLKRNSIDLQKGIIRVKGKNKKERIIPIVLETVPNFMLWLGQHDSDWIFPSKSNKGEPNTTRWVNKVVRKWADKIGLYDITPHSFRHAFGTYLYENNADIKAIQEMMGHESIDTTNIYAKTSIKRNRQEYIKAHPLIKRPK